MTTFLLIPGAGGSSWYWHLVAQRLSDTGHEVLALDLPADDPNAGLPAYVDLAVAAANGHQDLIVAAQSMGAFTAVPVCARVPARRLVLLNAMIPAPGETAGDWWEKTGWQDARVAAARAGGYSETFDLQTYFLHDVPPELAAEGASYQRDEADIAFAEPSPFTRWPDVATIVLAGRDDRFFPLEFQRRIARERLALEARPLPGGHLNALSRPDAVARALLTAAAASQSA
jgi:alpha-beta hydrolase superfamily lysophospholipase